MNYSEMSDFEIDRAVALHLGLNIKAHRVDGDDNPVFVIVGEKFTREKLAFQPCNSWADAGPIIQGNYLSIECDDMFDVPMPSSYWKAYNPKGNHYTDENPRRAAMIVFLMMQEQK